MRPVLASITFPTSPPSASDGAAVYAANCATCHGADGRGVVAGSRDFNDLDYMRAAAAADFYTSITNGKGSMPGFRDELSDGDRWNVTYYLWHWSVPDATLALGSQVYAANCVSCHGEDGNGAIPQAPAFTDVEFISRYSASQFFKSVSGGKGIMPAWQSRLSDAERWASVEYARAFAYQPVRGAAAPTRPAEATAAPPPTEAPTATPVPPPTAAPAPTEAPPPATAPPVATQAPAPPGAPAGDAAAGKQTWATKPCIGCHGPSAEGGIGPKLAGTALGWDQVLSAVRNGQGAGMPAFAAAVISDQELADIYAWLKSQ